MIRKQSAEIDPLLEPLLVPTRDEEIDRYLSQLLAALQRLRQQPVAHPIGDLRGLTAVIAHRACSRWMRRRFPERHALKNRLSYLCTRHPKFELWQGGTAN